MLQFGLLIASSVMVQLPLTWTIPKAVIKQSLRRWQQASVYSTLGSEIATSI